MDIKTYDDGIAALNNLLKVHDHLPIVGDLINGFTHDMDALGLLDQVHIDMIKMLIAFDDLCRSVNNLDNKVTKILQDGFDDYFDGKG